VALNPPQVLFHTIETHINPRDIGTRQVGFLFGENQLLFDRRHSRGNVLKFLLNIVEAPHILQQTVLGFGYHRTILQCGTCVVAVIQYTLARGSIYLTSLVSV
jgi:hypothetical protein